MIQNTYKVKQ